MRKKLKITSISTSLLLINIILPAHATDLMDVYNQALQSDPTYQAAIATRLATREQVPQAVAGLLPNLSATANTTANKVNTLFSNEPPQAGQPSPLGWSNYNTNGYTVTLSQPLFNFADWMQVRQASDTAKAADATLAAAAQDLMIRVATTYFNVLLAQDNLAYIQAEKDANARQLSQAEARYEVGVDAIATVDNAKASYDSVVAQEIAAENTLQNNKEALRQLTGRVYPSLGGFKITVPLLTPQPNDIEQWVTTAEQRNLALLAARYTMEAARTNIKENFAGHFPTVNAVGTYSRMNGASQGAIDTAGTTVGVQVSIPLFAGGEVLSQTREAKDNFEVASENRENTYRQTIITTRQEYNDVLAGISKLNADQQAIISAESSYISTNESYKAGTRTIVDVLLALQTLYQAKTNYAQDQYAYLLSTLQLKEAAGTLNPGDLAGINAWMYMTNTTTKADHPTHSPPVSTMKNKHHKKIVHKHKKDINNKQETNGHHG